MNQHQIYRLDIYDCIGVVVVDEAVTEKIILLISRHTRHNTTLRYDSYEGRPRHYAGTRRYGRIRHRVTAVTILGSCSGRRRGRG